MKWIKENKILIIIFSLLFFCLIYTHFNTFLGNDDLPYSFFRRLNVRVTNLFQIVWDNLRYYKSMNGRFIVHCIVMFLLMFGRNLSSILNPLVIISILYIFYKLIKNDYKLTNQSEIILCLSLSSLFLSLYNFKKIIYWIATSVNYLWVGLFIFIYIFLYLKKDILKYKKINFVILLLFSSLHENSFVFFIIFIIISTFIDYIKSKKLKNIYNIIPVIIGGALLLLSPGNMARYGDYSEWYSMSLLSRLDISIPYISKSIFSLFQVKNLLPTIYIIIIIIKLLSMRINKISKIIIPIIIIICSAAAYCCSFKYLYFVLAIVAFLSELYIHIKEKEFDLIPVQFGFYAIAFSMIITPLYYSGRPNLLIYIYFIFIISKYFVNITKNRIIKNIFIVLLSGVFAFLIYNECNIYYNIGKYHRQRLEQIEKFKQDGSDTLYLISIPDKYTSYHVDCNVVDENHWTYKYFVWYYGLPEDIKIRYK